MVTLPCLFIVLCGICTLDLTTRSRPRPPALAGPLSLPYLLQMWAAVVAFLFLTGWVLVAIQFLDTEHTGMSEHEEAARQAVLDGDSSQAGTVMAQGTYHSLAAYLGVRGFNGRCGGWEGKGSTLCLHQGSAQKSWDGSIDCHLITSSGGGACKDSFFNWTRVQVPL